MINLTYKDLLIRAVNLSVSGKIFGVPRGGTHAAQLVHARNDQTVLVEEPEQADYFIDDVIDSGKTKREYLEKYNKPFLALVNKISEGLSGEWVRMPWERGMESGIKHNITRLIQYIGDDPNRDGLLETPDRVVKSYSELFSGYKADVKDVMKTFEEKSYDQMVLLKGVEFSSSCEHHMLPFLGEAHIAYIPNGKVIGVSKLARILEIFSRRLQIQERLTQQITQALDEYLSPLGSACVLKAKHLCMVCRGVCKQNAIMVTSSLTGEFRNPEVRQEFFNLIG